MHSQLLDVGVHSRGVGNVLAAILAASTRPLTRILETLSGDELHLTVLASGERPLTAAEHYRLGGGALRTCRHRAGLLVTGGGVTAASTSLIWLPARLGPGTCAELDEGAEPAGVILGRLGMRREDQRAMATGFGDEITGEPLATVSSAVLAVGGQRVGIAEEWVTLRFAESLT